MAEEPLDPRQAFSSRDAEGGGFNSRVTLLLLLGVLFGSRREPLAKDLDHYRDEFPLPNFRPGPSLRTRSAIDNFRKTYSFDPTVIRDLFLPEDQDSTELRHNTTAQLVNDIYREPKRETAGDILLFGLGDPDELIRVAAAISFIDLFDEVSPAARALFSVVEDGAQQLARELAETALHRLGARSAVTATPPTGPLILPWARSQQDTTVMIHGSHFSFVGTPIGNWWQPGGTFHTFIQSNFRPNLYSRPDFYTWSGGWSDHARRLAAVDLRNWTHARGLRNIDVIAHSHGGNVAMVASQLGVEIKNLILLSCPAHPTHYVPHFPRVKNAVSYQIKLDWVVLADRGSTHFNHAQITDKVYNQWFIRHGDTHEPSFWNKFGLQI